MKKVRITTTLGKEYEFSIEVGAKIDQAIMQGATHVRVDPIKNQFLKVSTIAEKEDIFVPDPITDSLKLLKQPEKKRADKNSEGYKKFLAAKEKLFGTSKRK